MIYSSRLQDLERNKQQIQSQIEEYQNWRDSCYEDIKKQNSLVRRQQLNTEIDGYKREIDQLFDKLEEIQEKINKINELNLSSPIIRNIIPAESSLNNYLNNPNNQQELKIDESLRYIDFKKALETFKKIHSQFNKNGDVALFLIEEYLIKRGDLCLQRLRDNLNLNTNYRHRQNFRYCPVIYNSGNLESVIQGIGNHFNIKQTGISIDEYIKLIIQKIGDSLQNNSVLFVEINCDINHESEIDLLIPWFIENFWRPLKSKVNEATVDYEGIKVIAVIISNFNINQRLLTDKLSLYYNKNHDTFSRDKLVQIPLDNWTKDDIFNWLRDVDLGLTKSQRDNIASKIYNTTQGLPNTVCFALQQQWQILINPPTSC